MNKLFEILSNVDIALAIFIKFKTSFGNWFHRHLKPQASSQDDSQKSFFIFRSINPQHDGNQFST